MYLNDVVGLDSTELRNDGATNSREFSAAPPSLLPSFISVKVF